VVAGEMPVLCPAEEAEGENSSDRGLRERRVEAGSFSSSGSERKGGEGWVRYGESGDREEERDMGGVFSGCSECWETSVSEGVSSPNMSSPSESSSSASNEPS
jgi:hypothetical protein